MRPRTINKHRPETFAALVVKVEATAAVLEALVVAGPSEAMVVGLVGGEGFVIPLVGLMVVAAKLSRNREHSDKWRFGLFVFFFYFCKVYTSWGRM